MSERMEPHKWTEEEIRYLTEIIPGRTRSEALELMSVRFDYPFTLNQVTGIIKRYKLKSGVNTRFEKGCIPATKGTKGFCKPNIGTFKKGNIPPNHRPVGSERLNAEGYYEVKIAEPNIWRHKHRVVWEEKNGPVPEGHMVMFADGNRGNPSLENLICLERELIPIMVHRGLVQEEAEMTKIGVNVATVIQKINHRKKEMKRSKRVKNSEE